MASILTPAHHRSAALLRVVSAFAAANDVTPADRRVVVGKAKAIRLLIEAGANRMADSECEALAKTVAGITEMDTWPEFITGYIEQLRKVLK